MSFPFTVLAFKNDDSIKLGFLRPFIGIVNVFFEDIVSTLWFWLVKNLERPLTCCATPPIPSSVGEINNIFTVENSD